MEAMRKWLILAPVKRLVGTLYGERYAHQNSYNRHDNSPIHREEFAKARHGVRRLMSRGNKMASLMLARPTVFSTKRSMP